MRKRIPWSLGFLLALAACAPCVRAQSGGTQDQTQQPTAPEQPLGTENSNGENNSGDANTVPAIVTTDTENPPLSGVLLPSFGVPAEHSYIQPRFDFETAMSTNGEYSSNGNPNQMSAMETVTGGITIEKVGRTNELQVNYLGGRTFFSSGDISDSTIQNFGLMDKWVGMRWSAIVADQMSYTSDPVFGIGIGGTTSTQTGVNIQPVFTPGQGVITPRTPTLNNSSAAELDYQMSLRTSLSFAGTYSFLHYYGPGLINSGATNAQVGYNYRLNARDTIAGIYRYGLLNFSGGVQSVTENIAEFSYGHTVNDRWKFQVAGGPNFALIHQLGLPSQNYFSWTLTSSLAYQAGVRTTASVNYTHGLTGGGGTFEGGSSDFVNGGVAYQLSKNWSTSANVGYNRTATLPGMTTTSPANAVDTLVGGVGIKRTFGRDIVLGLNYQGYYQISGEPICAQPTCGTNLTYQSVALTFSWHPTPIPID
ncbi:MAG TPA: hypothetical protein VMJ93_08895 [Verrucomicrobiae bacterium]|nr:hypothetical protein [Verrucomicrobiae bacterium]